MDGVIIGKAKQYVYVFQWLININDVDAAVKIIEHIPFDQAEYHLIWQIPPTRPHLAVRNYGAIATFWWLGDDSNNGEGLPVLESMLIPWNFHSFSPVSN